MKVKSIIFIFLVFGFTILIKAQKKVIEGHLLRFDITQKAFVQEDTIYRWEINENTLFHSYTYYNGGFTYEGNDYLIMDRTNYSNYFPNSHQLLLYNNDGQFMNYLYSYDGDWDVVGPYDFFTSKILSVDNGTWLLNGGLGNRFLNHADSLYTEEDNPFMNISGKINKLYLVTKSLDGFDKMDHYLADLSSSPTITYKKKISIEAKDSSCLIAPQEIINISCNKYLLEIPYALYICSFQDSILTLDKKLFDADYNNEKRWTYTNNFLYYFEGQNLIKSKIDTTNNSVNDSTVLLSGISGGRGISPDNAYIVAEKGDTLFIYSTQNESFYLKYDLSSTNYSSTEIVVTNDNVYFHVTDRITDIEEDNDELPISYSLSQNYPNPFNPTTTINYQIPSAGHVSLKVYDILGREVATLVNEEKSAGNYEVKFDGSGLSSGIYFYRLQSGTFSETKKFVLIK